VKNAKQTTKRADLLRQAHAIVDEAEKRGSWTDDDQAKHDKIIGEIREIDGTVDTRGFNGGLTQIVAGERRDESPLLTHEQSLADHVAERRGITPGVDDGLGERDEFRLGRVIQARVTGDSRGLSDAERRAMAEGTDAAGGVLVPEQLSSRIIDRARAAAVVFQAGALTAPMESDTLVLARLYGGSDAEWKAENAAVTSSDQVWQRLELKAKTVVVEQILSRELFEDLSPAGAAAIENEIAKAIALKLDLAALEGSGTSPEPRGIANTTGVGSVDMGTDGLKPTSFDHLVQAVFACLKSNSEAPTAAVMHPRDAEIVALLKDSTGQPLRKPDALASLPFLYSSQIATDVTHGANDDTSSAYVGDFRSMIVGVRPNLNVRFQILSERFSDNLQVGILSWLRADIALARPADFAKVVGLRVA
jgi:HK97 family phage major capsid protein